jgi:hypothetical protein
MNRKIPDREYMQWLKVMKQKVLQAQLKAAAGTNRVLIRLYWELGREITEREKEFSYGENFLAKVAADLSHEFPEIKGFSRRNPKRSDDNPSIGILLCRTKDKIEAEYALRDLNKPIGVSSFELSNVIPENLKSQLPSIEGMEKELLGKNEL